MALVTGIPLIAAQAYTVEKGDTLYSISRKYGVSVAELSRANKLKDDNFIFAGQKLSIPDSKAASGPAADSSPSPQKNAPEAAGKAAKQADGGTQAKGNGGRSYDTYTVQKGDTFYNIAKVNDISVAKLKELLDLELA